MHTHIHMHTHTHAHTYTFTCTHMHMKHKHAHAHTHHIHKHAHAHTCTIHDTRTRTHTHTHIHTHTHTNGHTVAVDVTAIKGKVNVFIGTNSNVRNIFRAKIEVDADDEKLKQKQEKVYIKEIDKRTTFYIGAEPNQSPDAKCHIKYSVVNCTPRRRDMDVEHEPYAVPFIDDHCYYILNTPELSAGTVLTIDAKVSAGKVVIRHDTHNDVRENSALTMSLDVAESTRKKKSITLQTTSKMYIGVKLDTAASKCQLKYTTEKPTTESTSTTRKNSTCMCMCVCICMRICICIHVCVYVCMRMSATESTSLTSKNSTRASVNVLV